MSSNHLNDPDYEADRRAIEEIAGRPLPTEWPPGAMPAGTRVTVIRSAEEGGPWFQQFTGTIDAMAAPEPVRHAHAQHGELAYWVKFDEPQYDGSGTGPYRKAQIWSRYLRAE